MLSKSDLYAYQKEAVNHIVTRNGSMLWLDIGLGKTISSLTAIEHLLDAYKIKGALVVAPVKVIESVWRQEAQKWAHTERLRVELVRGTPHQRLTSLMSRADIYLINYENLQWLVDVLNKHWAKRGRLFPFDMVVFDEISKMKTSTSKRCKAFTKILSKFTYRAGLTGTPAANGIHDLHGQYLMVDGGHRLGANVTQFRDQWFLHDPYTHSWNLRRGASEEIKSRISDITIQMDADDYLELPGRIDRDYELELPKKAMDIYTEFEKEFFTELDGGEELEAFSAAAKSMKCRQMANGAVYTGEPGDNSQWASVHDEKLDMLEEIIEELNGSPLLICYQFISDVARIKERFPHATVLDRKNVSGKVEAWNRGEIKLMIGHPESMGHGLNLQYAANHIAWFGLPWSLELYDQAIGRLNRNGQKKVVVNHRIMAKDTLEKGILSALKGKDRTQKGLRDAVKNYRGARK